MYIVPNAVDNARLVFSTMLDSYEWVTRYNIVKYNDCWWYLDASFIVEL